MQVTAYSEQKRSRDSQPQLNSVSGLLFATCFGFWKNPSSGNQKLYSTPISVKVGSQITERVSF